VTSECCCAKNKQGFKRGDPSSSRSLRRHVKDHENATASPLEMTMYYSVKSRTQNRFKGSLRRCSYAASVDGDDVLASLLLGRMEKRGRFVGEVVPHSTSFT
jgi:hypothetical protein